MTLQDLPLLLALYLLLPTGCQTLPKETTINPTGTYRTRLENSDGSSLPQGIIKVKLLNQSRILVSFIMQNGEPLLRSGSFIDTLSYQANNAEFRNAEIDSTCKIGFHFTENVVTVKQVSSFKDYQCDFASGVIADGFYYKHSPSVPSFQSPY